jgi:hypothetical protein
VEEQTISLHCLNQPGRHSGPHVSEKKNSVEIKQNKTNVAGVCPFTDAVVLRLLSDMNAGFFFSRTWINIMDNTTKIEGQLEGLLTCAFCFFLFHLFSLLLFE